MRKFVGAVGGPTVPACVTVWTRFATVMVADLGAELGLAAYW
jgi:hypothetical protein